MPRILTVALCLWGAFAVAEQKPDELPTLLILNLDAQGVEKEQAAAVTDAVVAALAQRGLFRVVSTKDVQTLISAERQRQLLSGCDSGDCARDIGNAVNAKFVLNGSLSRVGSAYQLALQTLDTEKNLPLGRSIRIASDLPTLVGLVPYAASEATGTPLPPPKPRWLQYTMIAAGAGLVVGGGGIGMFALSRQQILNDELCPEFDGREPQCAGQTLGTRKSYQDADAGIAAQKTISLLMLGAGAGLVAAGILLLPPPEGGPRVALVPTPSGVALAGVFW